MNGNSEKESSQERTKKSQDLLPNPTLTRIEEFRENHDYIFRITLLGDSSVGKTSILNRYCDSVFKENYNSTIGVDFRVITLKYENICCKVHIWDTAGQERFRALAINYFRSSNGFMFIYDITSEKSFDAINSWIEVAFANSKECNINFLIGNKCDKEKERVISKERGEALAKQNKFTFLETSAMNSTNVDKAFELFTYNLIRHFRSFEKANGNSEATNEVMKLDQKGQNISMSKKETKKCNC